MRLSWKTVTPVVLVLGVIAWLIWRAQQPPSTEVYISTIGLHKCDVDKKEARVANGESLTWIPDAGHTYQVIFDPVTGTPVQLMTVPVPSPARTVQGTSGKTYVYTINDSSGAQCKDADPKVILK